MTSFDNGGPNHSSSALRHLRAMRLLAIAIAVVVIVTFGDFVHERLNERFGVLPTDVLETVMISLIIYLSTVPGTRAVRRAIVALDDLQHRFYQESIHDPLAGIHNRRYFDERLSEEVERARRYEMALSLVVVDVDHFKDVNDELGHGAGDAAIVAIAQRLEKRRRKGDFLARIGGEEFAVLLPNLKLAGAAVLAEEIRRLIEQEDFVVPALHGTVLRKITVSCGVAELSPEDEFDIDLVRRADAALYRAKKVRNTVAAG
jgi:diguanylate cyclase (GGDEF)-like protein